MYEERSDSEHNQMLLQLAILGVVQCSCIAPSTQLSVEQTIALCLSSPLDEGDRQYQKVANPKAKEVVCRLTKSKYPLVRHRAVSLLGYIGSEDDVSS